MEEYLKNGYELIININKNSNNLYGILVLKDNKQIKKLITIKDLRLEFLYDINILNNITEKATIISCYDLNTKVFTSKIITEDHQNSYGVISTSANSLLGSLYDLNKKMLVKNKGEKIMEEKIKEGYNLIVIGNPYINYLHGVLIKKEQNEIKDLQELQEENIDFLFDTSLATCLYKGEVLRTIFNKDNNLFESSLLEKKYKDDYNDEYTFKEKNTFKSQDLVQSIIKLDESTKKGNSYVKR